MLLTQTDLSNAQISFFGRGRSIKDITASIVKEWREGHKSKQRQDMIDANEYYMCRNIGIKTKTRSYYDSKGHLVQNPTLSNVKIPSAFIRLIVQQKVNYGFGKPFTIEANNPNIAEGVEDPNQEKYITEWHNFIDAKVRNTIKRIVKNAISGGIGPAFIAITNGQLEIIDFDSFMIYPEWADKAHTTNDAVVYDYATIEYTNNERKEIKRVQLWTSEAVYSFIDENGTLIFDPDHPDPEQHMTRTIKKKDGETIIEVEEPIAWGRVPFIFLKGNEDELPLLNIVREPIDGYDKLRSKGVDALLDDIDAVLLLKNVSSEMGTLIETRQTVMNSRIAVVDADGGGEYLKSDPNMTSLQAALEGLQKEIRQFSQSVETQDIKIGSNPSGVALKAMYQDLDTNINGLESEFEVFMENLKYFFDIWLEFKGVGTALQWSEYKLTVTLNRDMLIDESAIMDQTVKLATTGVSQETIDNYNPAVDSHANEQKRREAESTAARGAGNDLIFNQAVQDALAAKQNGVDNANLL